MWSDNETTQDLIGFRVHADLIRSIITDSKLLPITVGLFGDWGGGKTSIMKMLQHDVDSENYPKNLPEREKYESVVCLYFNGWLFEGYDDAKSALLSSILIELGNHKKFGPKIRQKAAELLGSVDWMRLARLGFREVALPALLAYLTGGVSLIPSIVSSAKSLLGYQPVQGNQPPISEPKVNWEEYLADGKKTTGPMDVRDFRERFSTMLAESDIKTLIVLIDDLDRCSPQRIIDNLEAIKLFLNVERTAFVIGADPRIVRHAITTVYKPEEITAVTGEPEARTDIVTDYLEKLIQIPYRLPRLSPAEVQTYMSMLFCYKDLNPEDFGRAYKALEDQRAKDRYSVFGYGSIKSVLEKDFPAELSNNLSFCMSVGSLITDGLKGNPRQVKRFLNAFMMRKKLADVARLSNIRDDVLVKLMVLEYTHLDQFNELFQWQSTENGHPRKLQDLENALCLPDGKPDDEESAKKISPNWANQFMRRWITTEPHLLGIDLRDYFWVARDRLQTTLSDVAMVSPIIRKIVENLLSENPASYKVAQEALHNLDLDESEKVLSLVSQQVERNPEEKSGYTALRLLIEWDIPRSVQTLDTVLQKVPSDKIPPPFGMALLILEKAKPEQQEHLKLIIEKLSNTKAPIAGVLNQSRKKGK